MSKKIIKGVVVSTKMDKTITVKVEMAKKHPRYGKKYFVHSKFKVHCEDKSNIILGDTVEIIEAAPISKTKMWKLVETDSLKQKDDTNRK